MATGRGEIFLRAVVELLAKKTTGLSRAEIQDLLNLPPGAELARIPILEKRNKRKPLDLRMRRSGGSAERRVSVAVDRVDEQADTDPDYQSQPGDTRQEAH